MPPATAGEWNSGSCDVMAVALHRLYGLPMMAEFERGAGTGTRTGTEVDGYLVHAWVRLPDGRDLDAVGPRPPRAPTPGLDPDDPWVAGYAIRELADDDPHLLDVREEVDYVDSIAEMAAYEWIAEHLGPTLDALGLRPVATPGTGQVGSGPGR